MVRKCRSSLTENIVHIHYQDQTINAMEVNNRCLFWQPCKIRTRSLGKMQRF